MSLIEDRHPYMQLIMTGYNPLSIARITGDQADQFQITITRIANQVIITMNNFESRIDLSHPEKTIVVKLFSNKEIKNYDIAEKYVFSLTGGSIITLNDLSHRFSRDPGTPIALSYKERITLVTGSQ